MKTLTLKERVEKLEEKVFDKLEKYKPVVCNGLMWSKIASDKMSWDKAMKYAEELREGGYKDWRLPTVQELQEVFDYDKGKSRIEFTPAYNFWSSTETYNSQSVAWYVVLSYGNTSVNTKVTNYAVRCVRRERSESYEKC